MKKLFYIGSGIGCLLLLFTVVTAQEIEGYNVDVYGEKLYKTAGDYKYNATSTQAQLFTEYELEYLKEEYNNNQEVIHYLEIIAERLLRIEKLLQ